MEYQHDIHGLDVLRCGEDGLRPCPQATFFPQNYKIISFLPQKRYRCGPGQGSSIHGFNHKWTLKKLYFSCQFNFCSQFCWPLPAISISVSDIWHNIPPTIIMQYFAMASSSVNSDRVVCDKCNTPCLAAADNPVDAVVGVRNAKSVFIK
jgi:hypothetical protein